MRLIKILLAAGLCAALSAHADDWLASADPLAAPIRPPDGWTVEQTPPDFSWPDVSRDARYTVNLTYPDGKVKSLAAPQNYINWDEVLPAGSYRWTVTATDSKGSRTSDARAFTVGPDAKPFLAPDMNKLLAQMKAKPHPRGLPDAAALEKMAQQRPEGLRGLRAQVDMRSREPVPPPPDTGSPSADNGRLIWEVKLTLNALTAYVLMKDERYAAEALRRVRNLASWDPNGTTAYTRRGLNMSARTMTYAMVLGYDWLQPKLDAATKKLLLDNIRIRLGHMHDDVIGARSRVAAQPRDSHGQVTAVMLGMMATLLAGDLAEADAWMLKALPLTINLVQPWGGEDGGFSNGMAYAMWDTADLQAHWYVLRWATGIDFAQKAWVRNYAKFLAYFNPPGTPVQLFGDGHEQPMLKEQTARFAKGYTNFAPSPLGRWYASRLSGEDGTRLEYLMSPPADSGGRQPFPAGTPNSLHLPTTGWVAMHSDLADEKRTSVYFKSSPPPHGAFNHQHADQNGFVVNAGGQRLAIESGYYDAWKSPHWWTWLHQTRAKNAITYDGGQGQIYFEATDYKKMGYGRITRFESTAQYDIATGDATAAYDGALKQALRSIVYLRPNLVLVHDKLASATPRRWEWNIHALRKMAEISSRKVRIENGGQSLCVEMLASPEVKFAQTDEWTPELQVKGDGKVFSAAAPAKGEPQWHGRFSTTALPAAEFIALLDVGCSGQHVRAAREQNGWVVTLENKTVRIDGSGTVSVF